MRGDEVRTDTQVTRQSPGPAFWSVPERTDVQLVLAEYVCDGYAEPLNRRRALVPLGCSSSSPWKTLKISIP
jgi:hypothetical protein